MEQVIVPWLCEGMLVEEGFDGMEVLDKEIVGLVVEDIINELLVVVLDNQQFREGGDVHLLGDAVGEVRNEGEVEASEEVHCQLLQHQGNLFLSGQED